MKVYIASTLSNADEAQAVSEALALDGWETTYPWFSHGSVQAEGEERIREVAAAEIAGVLEADLVIVVLPGGRGTHVELGIALAEVSQGIAAGNPYAPGPKRILLYGRGREAMTAFSAKTSCSRADDIIAGGATHDANGSICAFYLAPGVVMVEKDRGTDGLRLEALRAWREIGGGP